MSSSDEPKRQKEYLRTIYEPNAKGELPQHLIDIVFVHGLNPLSKADFANATWTHENGNFWPTQQLPKRIPSARILLFSYNSQVAWDTNENGIQEHANNLLDRLSGARGSMRTDNYNVPIIFVAHSLGGLVVKQALVIAKNDDNYISVRKATHSLVFFAVPHQGGHGVNLGEIAKNLVLSLTGDAKNNIIESLRSNSLFQETQAEFFKHQLEDYQIVSIYENRPTKLTRVLGKASARVIVDKKSATLGLPGTREKLLTVNSSHSEVCQFEDDDDKFEPVKRAIGDRADNAIAEQKKAAADRSRVDLLAQDRVKSLLNSLHFPSIVSRQESIDDAHKETFQWIFDGSGDAVRPWSNFVEWLEKGRGIYWITGKAGSGKSTLMSYICQDPRTINSLKIWAGVNVSRLIAPKFFFWNPGDSMQKSSVGLLRSLLYQILRKHPEIVALPETNEPPLDWTEKRLAKVFQSITRDPARSYRICFFIDGLDEFSGDYDALFTIIRDLTQHENVKAVLSSRPYSTFDRQFGSGAMLKLQDLTEFDIKKFVSDKLYSRPKLELVLTHKRQSVMESTILRFIDSVVQKADGVFLWVVLAVKDAARGIDAEDSLEQLEERLRALPDDLEDLYAHMLNGIDRVHREEAAWFLKVALLEGSKTLLDFTLATYSGLDHDLGCWASFPSDSVISLCPRTRTRILETCAGLLEVHEVTPDSGADTDADLIHVTFLHRTVSDFLLRSEQGRFFVDRNTTTHQNVFVAWAKVLIARVRMFGFRLVEVNEVSMTIETIIVAISNAEYETCVAQIAVCDYIERTMQILDQGRGNHPSGSHWHLRINVWASYWAPRKRRDMMPQDILFFYSGKQVKRDSFSSPVSELPIDFLGFAASLGLRFYVEQRVKMLPVKLHSRTVDYLLCCAINFPYDYLYDDADMMSRVVDLIGTLLKYGGDPSTQAFGSTIWGHFLARMMVFRFRSGLVAKKAWTDALEFFLKHGADPCGVISVWSPMFYTDISSWDRQYLTNSSPLFHQYRFRVSMSVPTLIRHCLGEWPASAEMLSLCAPNGAFPYLRFTEFATTVQISGFPKRYNVWTVTERQSDRFLALYEDIMMELTMHSAMYKHYRLDQKIQLLYIELSAREPDGFEMLDDRF